MSYHVGVHCHTCGDNLTGRDSLPYGLKPLFDELGIGDPRSWNGQTGVQLLPRLQSAIHELRSDSDVGDYKRRHDADSPEWSRVDFALPFLEALRDAICRDPYASVNVS